MEPSIMLFGLFGGLFFIISHYCAYKLGKYQRWLDTLRHDPRCRYEQEDMVLREGETFLGVVDARKGPYFFITNVRKDASDA